MKIYDWKPQEVALPTERSWFIRGKNLEFREASLVYHAILQSGFWDETNNFKDLKFKDFMACCFVLTLST